jgi:hypothetical protein
MATLGLNELSLYGQTKALQKVMKLTQKWKYFENNGTT